MKKPAPIGWDVCRKDGKDKVTGRTRYGDDIQVMGQLHGAVLHSPHGHAHIISIDVEKAKALPGVRAVITGEDCKVRYGHMISDQPVLAQGKVLYHGEPVAAVAADDRRTAMKAVRLIEVVYDPLPCVDTIEQALDTTVLLHENWNAYKIHGGVSPESGTNIVDRFVLKHGDPEAGFQEADVIVENEFFCSCLHHALMETHVTIADATVDFCHIWSPAQSPFTVRAVIADAFGYSRGQVRITCTEIGGGFGGKVECKLEPIAVALSLSAKRPVKLQYDRHEEFIATLTRAPVLFKVKTGAKKDGTITAQQVLGWWDTGAYATFGPRVNYNAGFAVNGPYYIPNAYVDTCCLVTNKALGTAYRGFGVTEAACAHEMNMDALAEALGMDPLALRLKNILRDGKESVAGERMQSVGVEECLLKCAEAIGWQEKPLRWVTEDGKLRGKGIACFIKLTGTPSATSVTLEMNEDGSLTLLSGSREMGQGVMTVLPMIAASALGMDVERIRMSQVDTDMTPYDKTTTSSRSTFHGGNATLAAVEEIKKQLCTLAAKNWKLKMEQVCFEDGVLRALDGSGKALHINDVGKSGILKEEKPVIATGGYTTKDIFMKPDAFHQSSRPTVMWMMGAQAAEVEVDPATGRVKIIQIGAANDVGCAINPLGCRQQIEGAVNMGVGHALLEEMIYQDGKLKNGNLVDYKVPTAMDADFETKVILVEQPHPDGPYGVKGIGEPGVAPTAPAIANAVAAATGRRYHSIPIKPEHILFGEEEL